MYVRCDSLYNQICPNNSTIFSEPERLPQFPGGEDELIAFLIKNIEYPSECKEQRIQERVIVKFIIDESGKIICPFICRSIHPALDKEALRIVALMPDWKPASNKNMPCMSCFTLPILFKLPNTN
ncbi:MAG: energy transducer TonB [Bacteroidales bacterium]|nr:energy transducer TonB [Bacteroidales bacterium]